MPIDRSWPGYNKGTEPDDGFEWIWQEAIPADLPGRDPPVVYIPFGYEKKVLPKGWKKTPENKALDLDIVFEKDVEFVMRDGVKVRRAQLAQRQVRANVSKSEAVRGHLPTSRHGRSEDPHHHALFSVRQGWRWRQSDGRGSVSRRRTQESPERVREVRGVRPDWSSPPRRALNFDADCGLPQTRPERVVPTRLRHPRPQCPRFFRQ